MSRKHLGKQSIFFENPPTIAGCACVGGKKESQGPLATSFDLLNDDSTFGQKSWEKAESELMRQALKRAFEKAGKGSVDYIFGGDLLNQCIATSFGIRGMDIPFFGLYGACSTMSEGLALASITVDGGFAESAAAVASSHFCSAERQYRYPLEYGGQRPPTSQWTVTGSGAVILTAEGAGPYITHATIGKIADFGIKDANNMGAAMAPADGNIGT